MVHNWIVFYFHLKVTRNICRSTAVTQFDATTGQPLPNAQNIQIPRNQILECFNDARIKISAATVDRSLPDVCPGTSNGKFCSETFETTNILKKNCNGLARCTIDYNALQLPSNCGTTAADPATRALVVEFSCDASIIRFQPFTGNTVTRPRPGSAARGGFGRERSVDSLLLGK